MKGNTGDHLHKLFLDLVSSPPAVITRCVACLDVFLGDKRSEKSLGLSKLVAFVSRVWLSPDLGISETGSEVMKHLKGYLGNESCIDLTLYTVLLKCKATLCLTCCRGVSAF